jgi:Methyltransferase domain
MKWTKKPGLRYRIIDRMAVAALPFVAPFTSYLARRRADLPRVGRALDRHKISYIPHHYYEPIVLPENIIRDLAAERVLPGIDMNADEQLHLLRQFDYADELREIAKRPKSDLGYTFEQPTFGPGDAEYLYSMVRHFKPRKIIEVGCGSSTKMIRCALDRNIADDPAYACEHLCIEPYENLWLESLGVTVLRQKVELVDPSVFQSLGRNDFLFIDSSHVIKPQGDVVFLYLTVLPLLASGVFVHSHDICTPRDYFPDWVLIDRRMWDEQYLLEGFLSFNSEFKVVGALNWLWHNHREETHRAFPILAQTSDDDPGSFWYQRV